MRQLIIEDAPSLERLLIFKDMEMDNSVISTPKLKILGNLCTIFPRLQFGTTTFQVSASYFFEGVCGGGGFLGRPKPVQDFQQLKYRLQPEYNKREKQNTQSHKYFELTSHHSSRRNNHRLLIRVTIEQHTRQVRHGHCTSSPPLVATSQCYPRSKS